jgi:hypothetical protein
MKLSPVTKEGVLRGSLWREGKAAFCESRITFPPSHDRRLDDIPFREHGPPSMRERKPQPDCACASFPPSSNRYRPASMYPPHRIRRATFHSVERGAGTESAASVHNRALHSLSVKAACFPSQLDARRRLAIDVQRLVLSWFCSKPLVQGFDISPKHRADININARQCQRNQRNNSSVFSIIWDVRLLAVLSF